MTDAELLLLKAAEHRRLLELHRKTGAECFREAAAKVPAGGVRERILLYQTHGRAGAEEDER